MARAPAPPPQALLPSLPDASAWPDYAGLLSWMRADAAHAGELDALVRRHAELCRTASAGIASARASGGSPAWAARFLRGYGSSIRRMRRTSSLAFAGFCALQGSVFGPLARQHPRRAAMIAGLASAFQDGGVPLAGRIIFAYREAWFLARGSLGAAPAPAGWDARAARTASRLSALQGRLGTMLPGGAA